MCIIFHMHFSLKLQKVSSISKILFECNTLTFVLLTRYSTTCYDKGTSVVLEITQNEYIFSKRLSAKENNETSQEASYLFSACT